ncbi:MAG: cupin domain-containing protein [Chitinophagales bacterium]
MRNIFFLLIFSYNYSIAQDVNNLPSIKQKQVYDNIITQELFRDSAVSTTVIWIKKEVKPHYHSNHTEQVLIVEGEGQMLLGHEAIFIKPGDLINIPRGIIHAVRVTSKLPMKVLSIQCPQMDESDRVMVQPNGW